MPITCETRNGLRRSRLKHVRLRELLVGSAMFFLPAVGHAAAFEACQPGDSDFLCRLRAILTLLDAMAIFLGVVLLVAILAAVRAYRRKPRKIAPEDITPDAR